MNARTLTGLVCAIGFAAGGMLGAQTAEELKRQIEDLKATIQKQNALQKQRDLDRFATEAHQGLKEARHAAHVKAASQAKVPHRRDEEGPAEGRARSRERVQRAQAETGESRGHAPPDEPRDATAEERQHRAV